jgi:hypothetical protein
MGQAVALDLIKQEKVKKVLLGDIITDPGRLRDKLRASEKVSLNKVDGTITRVWSEPSRMRTSSSTAQGPSTRRLWQSPRQRLKQGQLHRHMR